MEIFFGSAEKLTAATGWHLEIPFEKTLHEIPAFWRWQLKGKGSDALPSMMEV
jgi:hypothetical protein